MIVKLLVAEDTPGQKFIVVCLQCLRVKLITFKNVKVGYTFFTAGVNLSAVVIVHVSSILQ